MSDEHQQRQQQTQQHAAQQQQSHSKATKENPARKMGIHELRNQDYISRLMAATPPYLYSAPVGPNNFFFSDMLRSLVQARNNENARNIQLQQSVMARRPRKRSWSQHRPYYDHIRERKEMEEKEQQQQQQQQQQKQQQQQQPMGISLGAATAAPAEKPLELTNKPFLSIPAKYPKLDQLNKELCLNSGPHTNLQNESKTQLGEFERKSNPSAANSDSMQETPPAGSLPPQDLVLPPPPPVWYPPLYPPYGIDPLHFFIDLRVSGHICDRKKENVSPLANVDNNNLPCDMDALGNKHRHGSAFTVPVPRSNEHKIPTTSAINLSSASSSAASKLETYAKYYDLGETKENLPSSPKSSPNNNYVLQNLPRLYSQFAAKDFMTNDRNAGASGNDNYDNDNKSEPDCDGESDGRQSADHYTGGSVGRERDIDVEIIDSIKIRDDGESLCSTPDDGTISHQID